VISNTSRNRFDEALRRHRNNRQGTTAHFGNPGLLTPLRLRTVPHVTRLQMHAGIAASLVVAAVRVCGYGLAAAEAVTGLYPLVDAFLAASTASSAVSRGVVLTALKLPPPAAAMANAAASTLLGNSTIKIVS